MTKKILAVSQHAGGSNAISPVIKKLSENGEDVLTLDYGASLFKEYEIPTHNLDEFGVKKLTKENLEKIIKETMREFVLTGTCVKENYSIDQLAILASRKICPSLSVLDTGQEYLERFKTKTGEWILPDKIAVINEQIKKSMVKLGFSENILEATGNPYFDSLLGFGKKNKEELRKKNGILNKKFIISFLSQPIQKRYGNQFGFNEKDCFEILLSAINHLQEREKILALYVKHRSEDEGSFDDIISRYKDVGVNIEKNSSHPREAILISDVTCTFFSTSAYESVAMGIPAISIQPKKTSGFFIHELSEYIPIFRNNEEVSKEVYQFMMDENYRKERVEKLKEVKVDGKATERVVNLVYRVLN